MLKKGDFNESVKPQYIYGFELVEDTTGDIIMEHLESEKKLTDQELNAKHDEILERHIKEQKDIKEIE